MSQPEVVLSVRLTEDMVKRLDEMVAEVAKKGIPGVRVTRTALIRDLLDEGLRLHADGKGER